MKILILIKIILLTQTITKKMLEQKEIKNQKYQRKRVLNNFQSQKTKSVAKFKYIQYIEEKIIANKKINAKNIVTTLPFPNTARADAINPKGIEVNDSFRIFALSANGILLGVSIISVCVFSVTGKEA